MIKREAGLVRHFRLPAPAAFSAQISDIPKAYSERAKPMTHCSKGASLAANTDMREEMNYKVESSVVGDKECRLSRRSGVYYQILKQVNLRLPAAALLKTRTLLLSLRKSRSGVLNIRSWGLFFRT